MSTQIIDVELRIGIPDREWMTIPPIELHVHANFVSQEMTKVGQLLAKLSGQEVRWNVKGSLQGHYVSPEGKVSP